MGIHSSDSAMKTGLFLIIWTFLAVVNSETAESPTDTEDQAEGDYSLSVGGSIANSIIRLPDKTIKIGENKNELDENFDGDLEDENDFDTQTEAQRSSDSPSMDEEDSDIKVENEDSSDIQVEDYTAVGKSSENPLEDDNGTNIQHDDEESTNKIEDPALKDDSQVINCEKKTKRSFKLKKGDVHTFTVNSESKFCVLSFKRKRSCRGLILNCEEFDLEKGETFYVKSARKFFKGTKGPKNVETKSKIPKIFFKSRRSEKIESEKRDNESGSQASCLVKCK